MEREPILPPGVFVFLVVALTIVLSIGGAAVTVVAWILALAGFVLVCLLFAALVQRLFTRKVTAPRAESEPEPESGPAVAATPDERTRILNAYETMKMRAQRTRRPRKKRKSGLNNPPR